MVKLQGALMSLQTHGWLGAYIYQRHGVVVNPYPIGILPRIKIPYSIWNKNRHGFYKIPAFGLRPYPSFISQYYNTAGWCYQRRRTWHGIVWCAEHPPTHADLNTANQYPYRIKFSQAMRIWQGMDQATKDIYNTWRYPEKASGYNRFLSWYLKHTPTQAISSAYILLENYGRIKTEAGQRMIQES